MSEASTGNGESWCKIRWTPEPSGNGRQAQRTGALPRKRLWFGGITLFRLPST